MGELKGKTLLFVGGGLETVPGIRKAQALGLHVVVSDLNPRAPGIQAADAGIVASTYDVAATVAAATHFHRTVRPLDGVLCLATDVPLTVASVARELGLPGIPVEVAALAMDKLAMKRKFLADNVPVPWFHPIESVRHLQALSCEKGLPLVLKPVDSRGSRGVQLLRPEIDLATSFAAALHHSPTGRVMVEEYLPGPQVSTESVVIDGIAYTPGFTDRNYELLDRFAPHFIENGGDMPSRLPSSTQLEVRDLIQHAAASLGVVNGVVKGDIVVSSGRPFVIELAARLSGGYFCTHQIPLGTGVDLVTTAIRMALGERPDPANLPVQVRQGVAMRLFFPPGRVLAVRGVAAARQLPGIAELLLTVQPGDILTRPVDSNASAGMVIAVGHDKQEAVFRAEAAVASVTIETEPV